VRQHQALFCRSAIHAEAAIAKALDVPSQAAARHLGTLIKKIGDAIICAFLVANDPRPTYSAPCSRQSEALQIAVRTLNVRTGFHNPLQQADPRSIRRTGRRDLLRRQHPTGKKQPRELFEVVRERDDLTPVQIPSQTRRGDIRLTAGLKEATLQLGPDRGIAVHGTRRRKRIHHRRSPLLARASSTATIALC
jgi:hypothetical protein